MLRGLAGHAQNGFRSMTRGRKIARKRKRSRAGAQACPDYKTAATF